MAAPLPEGWYALTLEDGTPYYWNQHTNETTWEPPAPPAAAAAPVPPAPPSRDKHFDAAQSQSQSQPQAQVESAQASSGRLSPTTQAANANLQRQPYPSSQFAKSMARAQATGTAPAGEVVQGTRPAPPPKRGGGGSGGYQAQQQQQPQQYQAQPAVAPQPRGQGGYGGLTAGRQPHQQQYGHSGGAGAGGGAPAASASSWGGPGGSAAAPQQQGYEGSNPDSSQYDGHAAAFAAGGSAFAVETQSMPAPTTASAGGGAGGGYGLDARMGGQSVVRDTSTKFPKQSYSVEEGTIRSRELELAFQGATALTDKVVVREGPLTKQNRDGWKQYQFILLQDTLLYMEPNKLNDYYTLHREIPLETCLVVAHEGDDAATSMRIMSRQKSFVVRAQTAPEAQDWLQSLQEHIQATQASKGITLAEDDCAPVWRPNQEAKDCMLCNTPFTLMNRRHHCRNCGKIVCAPCSVEKVRIARIDERALFKVCNPCAREIKSKRVYGVQRK